MMPRSAVQLRAPPSARSDTHALEQNGECRAAREHSCLRARRRLVYAPAMRLALAAILAVGIAIATPAGAQLAQPVEGVWHLTGHVVATGCGGRCVTRRETVDQEVVIANGQLSGAEGLVPACESGLSEQEVDGRLTLVPRRGGRFKIRGG